MKLACCAYFLKTVKTYRHDLRLLHFFYLRVIVTFHSLTVFQKSLERALQCPKKPQLIVFSSVFQLAGNPLNWPNQPETTSYIRNGLFLIVSVVINTLFFACFSVSKGMRIFQNLSISSHCIQKAQKLFLSIVWNKCCRNTD